MFGQLGGLLHPLSFSAGEIPPWDSWVWHVSGRLRTREGCWSEDDNYLISWVAPKDLKAVQAAVRSAYSPPLWNRSPPPLLWAYDTTEGFLHDLCDAELLR
jgi:hypothetical protein